LQSIWRICVLLAATATATAPAIDSPRLYFVTTETIMPHLEENLRYAAERGRRCLDRQDLGSAFPILHHPSLARCRLREQAFGEHVLSYLLVCENSSGTTGTAVWRLEENSLHGTLNVKLGGKNMTFSQRLTATLLGACPSR
jgi:hypothetical protein